jgi:GNAT superfamily N-acetyltransferase
MASTASPPKFSLHPATPHDIPTLAAISSLAFKADTHTRLKELVKGSDHAEEMKPVLKMWMNTPPGRCSLIKAVSEGKVVGWVCWGFRGVDGPVLAAESLKAKPEVRSQESGEVESELKEEVEVVGGKRQEENSEDTKKNANIQVLEDLTNSSMASYQATLMPTGTKCLFIIAIAVLPSHQGRGIGRSLIKWGTQLADENGVFCWIHSSDAGRRVFEKEEFGEVGRLEVNLDEYAGGVTNEAGRDGRWGPYVFRYMKRPALGEIVLKDENGRNGTKVS